MTIPQATFRHARVCSVLALKGSSRAGRYDKYMATSPERAPMIAGALRSQRTHYGGLPDPDSPHLSPCFSPLASVPLNTLLV